MSNPFARTTMAEVQAHNARVAGQKHPPARLGEGVEREADLHDQIEKECRHRGWPFVHSRMDRRTTVAVGVVDFVIAADNGRTFWIEAKGAKTKVTREQAATIHWLQNLGHTAAVVRSLAEFLAAIAPNTKISDERL